MEKQIRLINRTSVFILFRLLKVLKVFFRPFLTQSSHIISWLFVSVPMLTFFHRKIEKSVPELQCSC